MLYPGSLVLELMQIAEEEIDTAVTEAYAEGYKAALLQYLPELASLRITEPALKLELEREKKRSRFLWPAAGISFVTGFLLHFLFAR